MKPDSYEFRSSHGYEAGRWSDWHTCTETRARELKYRNGFEVRALYTETESEQAIGLQQMCNLLSDRLRDNRTRLLAAMASIRNGDTELAMSILRSVTST